MLVYAAVQVVSSLNLSNLSFQITDSIENIPSAGSTPDLDSRNKKPKTTRFSPSMKLRNLKGKSASDLKIEEDNLESLDSVHQERDQMDKSDDPQSNTPDIQETTIQEYSIIEKCIKQYEAFFQTYFSRQILHIPTQSASKPSCSVTINLINGSSQNGSIASNEDIIEDNCHSRIEQIDKMFDTLKLNDLSRTSMLHNLLHKTMNKPTASTSDTSDYDYKECMSDSDKYGSAESVQSRKVIDESTEASVKQLMNLRLGQSLRCAVKLASSLLMEMSTFPSYNQNLLLDDSGEWTFFRRTNFNFTNCLLLFYSSTTTRLVESFSFDCMLL